MSLFQADHTVLIRLPERSTGAPGELTGRLLFQRDNEIAIRLEAGEELVTRIENAAVHGSGAQVEYRQGNYLCSFSSRFELVADRSLPVSLLLILPLPGTIKRVLDPE